MTPSKNTRDEAPERWWITLSADNRGQYVYRSREAAEGHAREFGGRAIEVVPVDAREDT